MPNIKWTECLATFERQCRCTRVHVHGRGMQRSCNKILQEQSHERPTGITGGASLVVSADFTLLLVPVEILLSSVIRDNNTRAKRLSNVRVSTIVKCVNSPLINPVSAQSFAPWLNKPVDLEHQSWSWCGSSATGEKVSVSRPFNSSSLVEVYFNIFVCQIFFLYSLVLLRYYIYYSCRYIVVIIPFVRW